MVRALLLVEHVPDVIEQRRNGGRRGRRQGHDNVHVVDVELALVGATGVDDARGHEDADGGAEHRQQDVHSDLQRSHVHVRVRMERVRMPTMPENTCTIHKQQY